MDNLHRNYDETYVGEAFNNMLKANENANRSMQEANELAKNYYDKQAKTRDFQVEDTVMLHVPVLKEGQNKKFVKFWKPDFEVCRLIGVVNVELQQKSNPRRKVIVHINRVKKQVDPVQEFHSHKNTLQKPDVANTSKLSQKQKCNIQPAAHKYPSSAQTPTTKKSQGSQSTSKLSRVHTYNLRPRTRCFSSSPSPLSRPPPTTAISRNSAPAISGAN